MNRQQLEEQLANFFFKRTPFRVTLVNSGTVEFHSGVNVMQKGKVTGFDTDGSPVEALLDNIASVEALSEGEG